MVKIRLEIDKKENTIYWNGYKWCDNCMAFRHDEDMEFFWNHIFGGLMNYVKGAISEDIENREDYRDYYEYDKVGGENMITVEISHGYDDKGTFRLDIVVDGVAMYHFSGAVTSGDDFNEALRKLKDVLVQKMGVKDHFPVRYEGEMELNL